jgi:hypothetical protein
VNGQWCAPEFLNLATPPVRRRSLVRVARIGRFHRGGPHAQTLLFLLFLVFLVGSTFLFSKNQTPVGGDHGHVLKCRPRRFDALKNRLASGKAGR